MKNSFYIIIFVFCCILGCSSSKSSLKNADKSSASKNDTVRIANDELKYEVIIIDPGFNTWLKTRAYPRGYHYQSYLEGKNRVYVSEWNNRALQSKSSKVNLYDMTINYDYNIDYGYEVNYLLYNYMIYFQNTYQQKLNGYIPVR